MTEIHYKYYDSIKKHSIVIPPSKHHKVYNGENLKVELREWLQSNTPAWGIDVLDAAADVDFLFDTKEEAMLFKLTWG